MAVSALWGFAHRALAPSFHENPARFIEVLDRGNAPAFLERMWRWALEQTKSTEPTKPPLTYGIERPRPGLVMAWLTFTNVHVTGEPWLACFVVRDPDPGQTNGYARVFFLEHSEYASELAKTPQAIVCEPKPDMSHVNWGTTLKPDDMNGFDRAIVDILRR